MSVAYPPRTAPSTPATRMDGSCCEGQTPCGCDARDGGLRGDCGSWVLGSSTTSSCWGGAWLSRHRPRRDDHRKSGRPSTRLARHRRRRGEAPRVAARLDRDLRAQRTGHRPARRSPIHGRRPRRWWLRRRRGCHVVAAELISAGTLPRTGSAGHRGDVGPNPPRGDALPGRRRTEADLARASPR